MVRFNFQQSCSYMSMCLQYRDINYFYKEVGRVVIGHIEGSGPG